MTKAIHSQAGEPWNPSMMAATAALTANGADLPSRVAALTSAIAAATTSQPQNQSDT
jgi:hypothetical protein